MNKLKREGQYNYAENIRGGGYEYAENMGSMKTLKIIGRGGGGV